MADRPAGGRVPRRRPGAAVRAAAGRRTGGSRGGAGPPRGLRGRSGGLGVALSEFAALSQGVEPARWSPAAGCRVRERLSALGAHTRAALDGVAGWEVCEAPGSPTAVTTLRRPGSGDPAAVVRSGRQLRGAGIVLTVAGPDRAPLMNTPTVLRVAPHLDLDEAGIDRLRTALAATA